MGFHFNSWLVYFYFYCICGWIFESTYVSIKSKKWVNRGFMTGPWLPIYGSGAITVLLVTTPFKQYPLAVYFVGMIAATVLEYVTGVLMVKLFKVRYWDYRYMKLQFQGHICLVSSITWGFLSILMMYVIHPPVVKFINMWNEEILSITTFVITLLIVYDFANAFREAMDLRTLIIQAGEIKEKLNAAFEEEKERISEAVEDKKEQIAQSVEEAREQITQKVEVAKEQLAQTVEEKKEQLTQSIEDYVEIAELTAVENKAKREMSAIERRKKIEQTIKELENAREQLRIGMEKHSHRLLLHNPGSSYNGMDDESKEVKRRLLERRRKKK